MKLFSMFFFEKLELLVIPGINLYPIVGINHYQSISDSIYTCMMYDCNIAINTLPGVPTACPSDRSERIDQ